MQFAQTFKELENYEEGEDHQFDWQPPSIYNKLDLIRNGEVMAFVKLSDHQSVTLAELRRAHQPMQYFTFSLKKFSPRGGVLAEFVLTFGSVFILDIVQAGAAERYLVTFSDARLQGSMPSKSK